MQKRLRQHNCGCRAVSGVGVRFLRCLPQKLRTGIFQRVWQNDRFRDACAVVRDEHWCAASRAGQRALPPVRSASDTVLHFVLLGQA